MGAPLSGPNHLPKAPSPNTITLGVRISTHEFGGRPSIYSKKEKKKAFFKISRKSVLYQRSENFLYKKDQIVNVLVFIGHIQSLSHSRLSLLLFILQPFKRPFLVYKSQENCAVLIFARLPLRGITCLREVD